MQKCHPEFLKMPGDTDEFEASCFDGLKDENIQATIIIEGMSNKMHITWMQIQVQTFFKNGIGKISWGNESCSLRNCNNSFECFMVRKIFK